MFNLTVYFEHCNETTKALEFYELASFLDDIKVNVHFIYCYEYGHLNPKNMTRELGLYSYTGKQGNSIAIVKWKYFFILKDYFNILQATFSNQQNSEIILESII